jgi:hypothetical protein
MRSTLGRRASICKEFGWTMDYVEHGISWGKLQMMIMDMPRLEKSDGKPKAIELTDDNAEEVFGMLMKRKY